MNIQQTICHLLIFNFIIYEISYIWKQFMGDTFSPFEES